MPSKQYNVFISYSHTDGETFAEELAERISKDQKGGAISFWKDYDEIHYGQWNKQIEKAIDSVEFLIMVITPEALASPNCKDEWMYARKKGVCILPVNGLPGNLNFFKTFPKWLEKQHVYNLEKNWERFINDLNTRCRIEPVPFMAPRLSTIPEYVPRKNEMDLLKNLILNGSNGTTVGITTSLHGSGGFGKTTLAIALCNDDEIINHFDDGILWVTLGQKAGTARDALHKLHRGISREEISFIDVEEAQQKIAEKIEKRNCLVVIDDVWRQVDLKQVASCLCNSTVLITTRFTQVLPQQEVKSVRVDEMKKTESIDLLTGKIKEEIRDKKAFEMLARRLGHWPLLLKLAGAQLTKRVLEGQSAEQALVFVEKKYDRKGVTGFDAEDVVQRDESVKKSLDASIELLTSDEKTKLLQLGIFPDDELIPYDIISALWQVDDFDTEDLLEKLHRFALLDLDFVNKTCSIHDVLLHYYGEQLEKTTAWEVHDKLVNSVGNFKTFKTKYVWKWYVWHLVQAGSIESANHLLQSLDWIEAKLFATDITELLKDYEYFSLNGDTDIIYRAIKLSAHVLAEDKNQLPAQLIGRLGYFENKPVVRLLNDAKKWKKMAWLKPVIPSLTPPGNLLRIIKGHTDCISMLLFVESNVISSSLDNTIRIWEIESGQCVQILRGHESGISSLLVHEGKIISGSYDNTVRIWDIRSGHCLLTLEGHTASVCSIQFYNTNIVSGSNDGTIRTWDIVSGQCIQIFKGHTFPITCILVHEGKLISGSSDSTIRIWDIESGQCLNILRQHTDWISFLAAEDHKLISGSVDGSIGIWDIASGERLQKLWGQGDSISALLVHNGKIISGSYDHTIYIWEISSGTCLRVLKGHTDMVSSLLVQDDKIISGSGDKTIRIWETASGRCLQILQGHTKLVGSLLIRDSKIISGSDDGTIRIWEIDSGYRNETIQGHTAGIRSLLCHQKKIISGSWDNTINIWEIETGQRLYTLRGHTSWISSLLVHEGKIISGSDDGTIRLWDLASGQCLRTLTGHSARISCMVVHEEKIISGSGDRTIRIWDLATGQCLHTLHGHIGLVSSLLVYNCKIISGSNDNTIRIWEIDSGQCLQKLEGHRGWISLLLVHESKIISSSYDDTIRIWEIASGQCLETLQRHSGRLSILLVDEGKIISGSYDSIIRIWEIKSGLCLQTLEGHTGRIRSLLVHEGKIISGSDDSSIRIWEIESGECLQILKGHTSEIRSLLVRDNKLISTDSSGLLILYDIKMYSQISKYYSDAEHTSQLVFEDNRIISGDQLGQLHILEMTGL